MQRIEISVKPTQGDVRLYIDMIVRLYVDRGYEGTVGTLKTYPGSTHWHLRNPEERGTIELTWWPEKHRCWISIHDNRRGGWQATAIEKLTQILSLQIPDELK